MSAPYVSFHGGVELLNSFSRHPGQQSENQRAERETRQENGIKEFDSGKLCGRNKVAYKNAPTTRFQLEARRDSRDNQCLQHYTRPQRKQIAERYVIHLSSGLFADAHQIRILAVPLRPNADYRSKSSSVGHHSVALPDIILVGFDAKHQHSFMMFNPVSANGKGGFKKGDSQ